MIPIFARIRRLEDSLDVETVVQKGNELYQEIYWTLTRIEDRPAKFRLDAEDSIDPSTTEEYALLNKSYHHVDRIFICKLFVEAGFPQGAVNIVTGPGSTGSLLASHMGISKISFTGSLFAGKKVHEVAIKSSPKDCDRELRGNRQL
jgi:hypothetical protein